MTSFSSGLEDTLHRSLEYANERNQEYATIEHLLLALVDDSDAAEVMFACNVDVNLLRAKLVDYIDHDLDQLVVEGRVEPQPTAGFQRIIHRAVVHVQSAGREQVTGANVLVALFAERESHAAYFLNEQDMTRFDAVNYINHGIKKANQTSALDTISSNDFLLKIQEYLRNKILERNDPTPDTYADELSQRPATFAFSLRQGRIEAHATDGDTQRSDIASDFYIIIQEKANDAKKRCLKSNVPNRVQLSIERLLSCLGNDLSDVRPGILLMRFRSIEADVSAYNTLEGRRELGEDTLSILSDLASSVEDLMGCFPQLASLEAERLALRLQDADIPSILAHLDTINIAAINSEAVDQTAIDALMFGEDVIRENSELIASPATRSFELAGAIQERAKLLGQKLLDYRNFAARLIVYIYDNTAKTGQSTGRELNGIARES